MKNFFGFIGRNWKTSAAGAIVILSAIPQVAPFVPLINSVVEANPQTKMDWVGLAVKLALGGGLLAAKDANVTGGNKPNHE